MPRQARELSKPRELVQRATLGLPLRGLSCPASEPGDVEPPCHDAFPSLDPDRRGAEDGRGAADHSGPGGAAFARGAPAGDAWKQPPEARARARVRMLTAMLGLGLGNVLAHAAQGSTAMRKHVSRRSR